MTVFACKDFTYSEGTGSLFGFTVSSLGKVTFEKKTALRKSKQTFMKYLIVVNG